MKEFRYEKKLRKRGWISKVSKVKATTTTTTTTLVKCRSARICPERLKNSTKGEENSTKDRKKLNKGEKKT